MVPGDEGNMAPIRWGGAGSVPCVHLLWTLHRVPHTVRPVEWTSHRLWDPHIQSCARTKRLSTHQLAFAGERPRVGRGPVQLPVRGAGLTHISPAFSHTPGPYNSIHCSFSPRDKKKYIALEVSLAICSRAEHQWWVGETMSKWESSRRWGTAFHPKAGISTRIARKNQRPNPQLSKEFMTVVLKNHQLEICRKEGKNEQTQSDMCKKYAK